MVATIEENGPAKLPPELKTEGPLFEKDQQGLATEQQRKLGEIALAKWRRLKEKIVHPFNK
ncbi:MAG: hypothetical protein ABIN13_06580 [Mucilaginibacter sp.]